MSFNYSTSTDFEMLDISADQPSGVSAWNVMSDCELADLTKVAQVTEAHQRNAAALARKDKNTKATAWNNRLASLAAKGLIVEESRGRAKYYRPVLEML